MKDYKLSELKEICTNNNNCELCPLCELCDKYESIRKTSKDVSCTIIGE